MESLVMTEQDRLDYNPKPYLPPFTAFPKIPRLRRNIIVTEKIDGTNAQVHVTADGQVFAGSRTRWITPEHDNYGFARWVKDNEGFLATFLGPGTHFGEWWGAGIQRRYGLSEKRFSLFNSTRWIDAVRERGEGRIHVVPTMYLGDFSDLAIQGCLDHLRKEGSMAAPGWTSPEGVVVYMTSSASMHKILLDNDGLPKGKITYGEAQAQKGSVLQ